jgi:L-iditol 2-dehydrogenase
MTTMRAAVLTEPERIEIQEREVPAIGDGQVLVEMSDVGICGSDVHFYRKGRIGDYVAEDPLVLGHESAGVVDDVGASVAGLEAGDRVAVEPGVPCRRCEFCKRGEYQVCQDVTFMAAPPDDGAFTEYVAWPADFVYPIPKSMSMREAALCEPLSCGVHVNRTGEVGLGDTVLVTGDGPIGILAMAVAGAAGATDRLITGRHDEKLDIAKDLGADRTINVREEDPAEAIDAYTDGRGVDVAIEAAGASAALETAIDAIRPAGQVVLYGLGDRFDATIDVVDHIVTEVDLRAGFRYSNTYPAAIGLIENENVDVERIIDFEPDLTDVEDGFKRVIDSNVVKGIVSIGE